MEGFDASGNLIYKKTKMCAFFPTTGCYHGASCDYAHHMNELQPTPDLRKSTLCINYTRGYVLYHPQTNRFRRCSLADCRFAHGMHELRDRPSVPRQTTSVCQRWLSGNCTLGAHCRYPHTFAEEQRPPEPAKPGGRLLLSLDSAISSIPCKVISLDDSLPSERRRLDLFSHLDFDDEETEDWEGSDGGSILSSLSREVLQLNLLDDTASPAVLADGDHSPWSLPR